jgi:RpiB/LacA/LacB family sugar-phosphate isomerase
MNIYIAADHGGFNLKNEIMQITKEDVTLHDLGPDVLIPDDDYPDYAQRVAEAVQKDPGSRGVLICRSGNGMVIAANKFQGIYAALCFSKQHAIKAVSDDNANVICLDSDYEGQDPIEILHAFLSTGFDSSVTRFERRFQKIKNFEDQNFK